MRILHTADWHLGRTLEGRSRLEEQVDFIDELVAIVEDQQIDIVLMAGDVYDTVNPPAAAEQLFYEGVARIADGGKRHVIVIAGNHDNPDRISASGPLAKTQGITLVGLPTSALQQLDVARTGERAKIFALPYPSESRLRELLVDQLDEQMLRNAYSARIAHIISQQTESFTSETVNLMISHVYVMGGAETDSERPIQVGGAYTVDTTAFGSKAQYVALGHLHRPQNLKAQVPIRYSGSPLAYSFSEAGQTKSVTILDISPGEQAVIEEIYLRSGRPLVKWQAKGGIEQVHQWLDEGKDEKAWIDLELHLTDSLSMDQLQKLRKLHSGIVHIRPIYPEMEALQTEASLHQLPMDEIFRRFYTRQTGGALPDPEIVELFMELIHEQAETAVSGEEWQNETS